MYIGIAMVYPHWNPYNIYKDFVHFHLQFQVDFTFIDIKVKNVWKNNQYTKIGYVRHA